MHPKYYIFIADFRLRSRFHPFIPVFFYSSSHPFFTLFSILSGFPAPPIFALFSILFEFPASPIFTHSHICIFALFHFAPVLTLRFSRCSFAFHHFKPLAPSVRKTKSCNFIELDIKCWLFIFCLVYLGFATNYQRAYKLSLRNPWSMDTMDICVYGCLYYLSCTTVRGV